MSVTAGAQCGANGKLYIANVTANTDGSQMYRLTIRATQDTAPKVLLSIMQERLSQGVSNDDN